MARRADQLVGRGQERDLVAQVTAALDAGEAERLDSEVAFVLDCLRQDGTSADDAIAARLRLLCHGVSPYQVFGRYPIANNRRWLIEVPRDVMPPGADTAVVIKTVQAMAQVLNGTTIVDFGCGTGVLGLAAALAAPDARLVLIDIDPTACRVALDNAHHVGVAARAQAMRSDTLDCAVSWHDVRLVVANLPFVPSAEVDHLPRRYATHVPRAAVDGGPDGLSLFRDTIDVINAHAEVGTIVVLQTAPGRTADVEQLFGSRWQRVELDAAPYLSM